MLNTRGSISTFAWIFPWLKHGTLYHGRWSLTTVFKQQIVVMQPPPITMTNKCLIERWGMTQACWNGHCWTHAVFLFFPINHSAGGGGEGGVVRSARPWSSERCLLAVEISTGVIYARGGERFGLETMSTNVSWSRLTSLIQPGHTCPPDKPGACDGHVDTHVRLHVDDVHVDSVNTSDQDT